MIEFSIEVVETLLVVAMMIVMRLLSRSAVSRSLKKFKFTLQRRKVIIKLINVFVVCTGLISIGAIWGMKQSDLFLFLSSLVTVLGIAFFAQWSLLSNITSGLILFFNHPIKLGDSIKVHDKDFPLEGIIKDIGYYFVRIESASGETFTIPNSVLLQKMVSINYVD